MVIENLAEVQRHLFYRGMSAVRTLKSCCRAISAPNLPLPLVSLLALSGS
jgi:hypothetical protein